MKVLHNSHGLPGPFVTKDVHQVFADYFPGFEFWAYAVSDALARGHICLEPKIYLDQLELKSIENPYNKTSIEDIPDNEFVDSDQKVTKPFVFFNGNLYLQRYFKYETLILDKIKEFSADGRLKIITGGPGTGKTYSVATELVQLLQYEPDLKIALAAPSGKAAARMTESIRLFAEKNDSPPEVKEKLIKYEAVTVHRLLEFSMSSVLPRRNERNPLPFEIVIIDECSMVDGAMMAKLLTAIGTNTTIFLLGDKDQLSSVEAGSVFGDICKMSDSELLKGNVTSLTKSRRFNKAPDIGRISTSVIKGEDLEIQSYSGSSNVILNTDYSEDIFVKYAQEYEAYIREKDINKALKLLGRVCFLCVTRENTFSVAETNEKIEKILKASINDPALFKPERIPYHNQPIIITKNNYELKLNNGDIGIIRKTGEGVLKAFFPTLDQSEKSVPVGFLSDFETVFAMTIHKSQGSEYDKVAVILPENKDHRLLTRELLYTAITRAKEQVLIQTSTEVMQACVSREVKRSSGLQERLNNPDHA